MKIILIFSLLILSLNQNNVQADMFLGEFVDHSSDVPITSEGALRTPESPTSNEFVVYGKNGDQNHRGYLSQSTAVNKKSGLIVIHEWWGLNDQIRAVAAEYAKQGYYIYQQYGRYRYNIITTYSYNTVANNKLLGQ